MAEATMILPLLFAALTITRIVLALRHERTTTASGPGSAVTVIQPILGGDPLLESVLHANASLNPQAHFLWLTDIDDPQGQAAADRAKLSNVTVLPGPPPSDGENPKLAKLHRAFAAVQSPVTMVLDDDTVIAPAALHQLTAEAASNRLATALPTFAPGANLWEILLAAFVNGNAWLTYFPVAASGAQHTINGMAYAFETETLRRLGGFQAAGMALTDDYAVAKLFTRAGVPILQSTARVRVSLTLTGPLHYWRVMRRWMIFARLYFSEQRSPVALILAGVPAFLPLIVLLIHPWLAIAIATAQCLAVKHFTKCPDSLAALTITQFLNPFFFVASLVFPQQLTWRSRDIRLHKGQIRYRP
jgi:ceramide glucosyltransferase